MIDCKVSICCCAGFRLRHDVAIRALSGRRPKSAKARSRGKLGTVRQRALGKFERAARLRKFEDWRPRLRAQLQRSVPLMFATCAISNSCAWRNSTSDNHCAINRSNDVLRHGVDQFLASRKETAYSRKLGRIFVKGSFCHCVIGAADDAAGHMRIRAACDMCCTPTQHLLIVLTLTRCRGPLDRLPTSRLLPPRSGLERSDFARGARRDILRCRTDLISGAGYSFTDLIIFQPADEDHDQFDLCRLKISVLRIGRGLLIALLRLN